MPKLAGPWLAGAQDSDRAAAKAAQDSLKQIFNSPEKLQNVGKAFQEPILEYCRDAVLNETIQTLSDERAVSADDAEATFSRVIATSISVVSNLLRDLSPEETAKQQETYDHIIGESKIWEFAAYKDVVVRRHVHRLLRACLVKQKPAVESNLKVISKAYIDKALHADQTGSSYDLMQTLVDLTVAFPHAWTSSYAGKKAAGERLRQGLKKGSQAGTADFWTTLGTLFSILPGEVLPKESAEVTKFLTSLRDGVGLREERFNASAAWDTYFRVFDLLLTTSSLSKDESDQLILDMALPVVEQYLKPAQSPSAWSITGAKAAVTVSKVVSVKQVHPLLELKWSEYTATLIQDMKTSSPEQSKDFDKSQTMVAQTGERWALLQSEFVQGKYDLSRSLLDAFERSTQDIVQESVQLLQTRNGKPYGAAAVLDELINHCFELVIGNQETHSTISAFILTELPQLLYSPSQRHLFSLIYHYQSQPEFTEAWNNTASSLANSPDSVEKLTAFRNLLSLPRVKPAAELAASNVEIQALLRRQYQSCINSGEQWAFLAGVLRATPSVAAPETVDKILADLTDSLSISEKAVSALQGLGEISVGNDPVLRNFVGRPDGSQLLPNLLHLQESPDEAIAQKASNVSKRIVDDADKISSQALLFDVVHQSLNNVNEDSLPISSVLVMASKLIDESLSDDKKPDIAIQALPNLAAWADALSPFLYRPPPSSQAITSMLGGAVYLVHSSHNTPRENISRDGEGFSQALRFVLYVSRVYSNSELLESLDPEPQATLFKLYSLSYTLMQDGANLRGPEGLASSLDSELEVPLSKYQSEVAHLSSDCFSNYDNVSSTAYGFVGIAIDSFFADSKGEGPSAYYNAEAFGLALAELQSAHGDSHGKVQEYEDQALHLYKSREVLPFAACAVGLSEALISSKKLDRQTNELVADLTGLSLESPPEKALEILVMLNALLTNRKMDGLVAKQRLIFLMKHILPWLEMDIVTPIKSEICNLLCILFPGISDMYGEHWSEALGFVIGTWSRGFADVETETLDHEYENCRNVCRTSELTFGSGMVLVHNTLRLYGVLRSLTVVEDPNDDLLDAWKESEDSAYKGLVSLLKASNSIPDADYLPLNATFDMLALELSRLQSTNVEDAGEVSVPYISPFYGLHVLTCRYSSTPCCTLYHVLFDSQLSTFFTHTYQPSRSKFLLMQHWRIKPQDCPRSFSRSFWRHHLSTRSMPHLSDKRYLEIFKATSIAGSLCLIISRTLVTR